MGYLLNLGCGKSYHPDWVNVDFIPHPPHVIGYDLTFGVPFSNNIFDVVYHSHILEHFSRHGAKEFLRECLRVLRPGGIFRLAVPDLEGIVRAYLHALEEARRGEPDADNRHEWMIVELVDQLTRHVSGGEMLAFWGRRPVPAQEFILSRVGAEARHGIADAQRISNRFSPKSFNPLEVGRFRLSGECHLWMYDSYSLERLLHDIGFTQIRVTSAMHSDIPDFGSYHLDVEADGTVRKPDSLFLEARKPDEEHARGLRVTSFCMQHFGGAGGAAMRLNRGLQDIGVSSFMYVVNSNRPTEGAAVIPATSQAGLIREEHSGHLVHPSWYTYHNTTHTRLRHYPNRPTHYEIFSDAGATTDLKGIPRLDETQIIHLHWIPGTVDMSREVEFLRGRPLVWTLHDMNPITGGCHYAEGCRHFERYCGCCPQLGSNNEEDYSREQWIAKKNAYRELDITVVCPSRWLAEEVRRSTLLCKAPVHVIPNGVPTDIFKPLNRKAVRQGLNIRENDFVVLFGSDQLITRRKGYPELLNTLEQLRLSGHGDNLTLLTFGAPNQEQLKQLPLPYIHLGSLHTQSDVALALNAADCMVVPSLEDNLPNVVLEAMACGLPVVSFDTGGIPDMITDGEVGRLVPKGDTMALAVAIASLRQLSPEAIQQMRLRCRQTVLTRFTILQQARAYAKLYESLLEPDRQL